MGNRPEGNFYGIKLQQRTKFPKKSNGQGPDSYDYDYYMSQPFTPDTSWHFSNQPYKQIHENILNRSGYAQVKIHFIDCPKELEDIASSITIRTTNQITKKDKLASATLHHDNCYIFDLNLAYPQYVYAISLGTFFIIPGDTLDVFTTMEQALQHGSMAFRSIGESAMISSLLPKFVEKYGMDEYKLGDMDELIEKGKDAVQPLLERWANQTNEILANEEFRQALINSPLSTFGKDVVMMNAVTNKCIRIEYVGMDYGYTSTVATRF